VPKIKLVVEYDGSQFHGWQKQPGLRTVQSELEQVLAVVCRQPISPLHAAGRTDSGVHARGQVVTFTVSELPDLWRLAQGVSHLMKGELAVLSAEAVHDSFHPGVDSTHKQYSYRVLNRPSPAVLDARRVWHISRPLNLELMRACAASLVGEHDFSSFQDSECCAKSPVKTIYVSGIQAHPGGLVVYRVIGSGFLKQMVRNIVGSLVDVGRGRLKVLTFSELLESKDRRKAGVTAPAHGLSMDWVSYDPLPDFSHKTSEL
jgi:tRNA pseudouridine38-40 synthase